MLERSAAIGAALLGRSDGDRFAREIRWEGAPRLGRPRAGGRQSGALGDLRIDGFELLDPQLQLRDLCFALLAAAPELQLLKLEDIQLERLNERSTRSELRVLLVQQRLELSRVQSVEIGKRSARGLHAFIVADKRALSSYRTKAHTIARLHACLTSPSTHRPYAAGAANRSLRATWRVARCSNKRCRPAPAAR